MWLPAVLIMGTLPFALAQGQNDSVPVTAHGNAQITITINPEARLSVVRTGELPPPVPCGTAVDLRIKIRNQAFATGELFAKLLDEFAIGAELDFRPERLTGALEEERKLRIILAKTAPVDLTIAFQIRHDSHDLGGRDRIHFVMRCV